MFVTVHRRVFGNVSVWQAVASTNLARVRQLCAASHTSDQEYSISYTEDTCPEAFVGPVKLDMIPGMCWPQLGREASLATCHPTVAFHMTFCAHRANQRICVGKTSEDVVSADNPYPNSTNIQELRVLRQKSDTVHTVEARGNL